MRFIGGGLPQYERYSQCKLANAAYAMALHEKLKASGSKVKALFADPGQCATSLLQNGWKTAPGVGFGSVFGMMIKSFAAIGLLPSGADGATPLIAACFASDAESGDAYSPCNWSMLWPLWYIGGFPPQKCIMANAKSTSKQAVFNEKLTLDAEIQKLALEATERAIA